jgi:hypothetical protein
MFAVNAEAFELDIGVGVGYQTASIDSWGFEENNPYIIWFVLSASAEVNQNTPQPVRWRIRTELFPGEDICRIEYPASGVVNP